MSEDHLKEKVKELFSYLDRIECSDEETWFRPNVISSVRCMQAPKIEAILIEMRTLVGLDPPVNIRELNEKDYRDSTPYEECRNPQGCVFCGGNCPYIRKV
jgi:hypothetical protein